MLNKTLQAMREVALVEANRTQCLGVCRQLIGGQRFEVRASFGGAGKLAVVWMLNGKRVPQHRADNVAKGIEVGNDFYSAIFGTVSQ
jgi:hypothetical protein